MKKIIVFLFLLTVTYLVLSDNKTEIIIPKESIRLRIIANSNEAKDQIEKYKIKEEIETIVLDVEKNSNNIEESRNNIENSIAIIESKLDSYNTDYSINFGENYFPEKIYSGVKYEEGIYESLVITIGEGAGDNWWCVLFPPLCLVDEEKEEYSLYVKNIIEKF